MNAPEKVPDPNGPSTSTNRAQVLLEINNAIASHLELAPLLKAIFSLQHHTYGGGKRRSVALCSYRAPETLRIAGLEIGN